MSDLASLRTVGRILEFYHLPLQHQAETLRDIYMQVSGVCDFDNFIKLPGGGARLERANEEGNAVSTVSFLKDRIQFREEPASGSLEHFLRRVEATLTTAVDRLSIPLFVARSMTFRAVAPAPAGGHASAFLGHNVFQLEAPQFEAFDRPAQLLGFRMQFPPKDPSREALHQVRVEAYLRDPRSLFVEDWATFKVPAQARDWNRLAEEARSVERFLNERIAGFLGQFRSES